MCKNCHVSTLTLYSQSPRWEHALSDSLEAIQPRSPVQLLSTPTPSCSGAYWAGWIGNKAGCIYYLTKLPSAPLVALGAVYNCNKMCGPSIRGFTRISLNSKPQTGGGAGVSQLGFLEWDLLAEKYDALGLSLPDLCANSSSLKSSPLAVTGRGHSATPCSVQRDQAGGKAG